MSRFVRASKVRHLFAEEPKSEKKFTEIRLSPVTGDHQYIKANSKYFAVAVRGGGGAVLVHPIDKPGRIGVGKPVIAGHSSAVIDFDFNPFNDHQIATASEDLTLKIFSFPEGGLTEKVTEADVSLEGHERKVTFCKWHPTASNILASGSSDQTVRVWDTETGEQKYEYKAEGIIQDLQWNYDGSLLGISCKDKTVHIFDPRNPDAAKVINAHEGAKTSKIGWLGSTGMFITCGFTKRSKREFKLWDSSSDLSKPVTTIDIDSGSGVLFPYFDEGVNVLYLMGRGDGNIRYYEWTGEKPYFYSISEFRSSKSQKGCCVCPKLANNILGAEVTKVLKLTTDSVIPLGFTIPRKSDNFLADCFPDDYAGVASMTADEWCAGENKDPVKMSMNPKNAGDVAAAIAAAAGASVKKATYSELVEQLKAANARIAELEAELAKK